MHACVVSVYQALSKKRAWVRGYVPSCMKHKALAIIRIAGIYVITVHKCVTAVST